MFWAGLGVGLGVGLILHIAAVVLSELLRSLKGTAMRKIYRSEKTGRFVSRAQWLLDKAGIMIHRIKRKLLG